jgi:hypothetical protein
MSIALWFAVAASLAGFALGMKGFLDPKWAGRLVGLQAAPEKPEGFSELRATYGGLFAGAHLASLALCLGAIFIPALVSYALGACAVLAFAWIGTAKGRVWSLLLDPIPRTAFAWGSVGFEAALGLAFAAPWLALALGA